MSYNNKIIEYSKKRDRFGQLVDAKNVGIGYVGNAACGDMLKIYLQVSDDNRIQDIKVKTYGCGCAIASTVLAAEKLIGKSLDEARLLTNKEIADELDLPGVKKHCSVLAESAVKSAIDNYLSKQEDDCVQNADEQMLSVNSMRDNELDLVDAKACNRPKCCKNMAEQDEQVSESEVAKQTIDHAQNQASKQAFTITPAAHKRFCDILLLYPGALGIIIGSEPGGCAGNAYYLDVAQQEQEDCKVYQFDGLTIFVPKSALMFILGVIVDYEETPTQAGFKFTHPGLKSCGCGESFR